MPAVVRIKRRIDEEPHTAFVLNGKRRKLHNDENSLLPPGADPSADADDAAAADKDELTTVLKFAGTLAKQDDCATKQFAAARLNKATAKELVQQKSSDAAIASALRRDRQRLAAQQTTREQRFRVVNCLRTTLDGINENEGAAGGSSSSNPDEAAAQITILDIESQQQQQQHQRIGEAAAAAGQEVQPGGGAALEQQQPVDSDIGYVYDLYVPENEMQAAYVDMMDDNYLSFIPMGEIVLEDCYNDADEEYDSEDSNQENYYANDYPDDEDAAMGSDDELAREMNKFVFDDDEDEDGNGTSSDSEGYNTYHDPYVHSIDTSHDSFTDDVDFCNTDRERGSAYERYRRRIMRELAQEGLNPPPIQLKPEDLDSDEKDDEDEDSFASADDK